MAKKRYYCLVAMILNVSLAIITLTSSNVFAAQGDNNYGYNDCGGSRCYSGAVWVEYQLTKDGVADLPNNPYFSGNSSYHTAITKCTKAKGYDRVAVLVRNEKLNGNYTGYPATTTQLRYVRYDKTGAWGFKLDNTSGTSPYYTPSVGPKDYSVSNQIAKAKRYLSMNDAYSYYQRALAYDERDLPDKWTKNSKLGYVCIPPEAQETKGHFFSKSSISTTDKSNNEKKKTSGTDDTSGATLTVNLGKQQTAVTKQVTFTHAIYTSEAKDIFGDSSAKAYTNFTVKQTNYNSKTVKSETTTYVKNWERKDFNGTERYRKTYTNSLNVTVQPNSSVTVCQQITYSPKYFKITESQQTGKKEFEINTDYGRNGNGDGSHASKVCVTIKATRETTDSTPGGYCPGVISSNAGDTCAKSEVINYSGNNTWTNVAYAKPGDQIRFRHTYQYGAQAVTTSETNSNRRAGNVPANWFYLTAYRNNNYLFDRTNLVYRTTLTAGQSRPSQVYGIADVIGNYNFTIYSPKTSSTGGIANRFDCTRYNFNDGNLYSYQVPGFGNNLGNCRAQSQTAYNSDVGSEISQTFHYNNIKAWVGYYSNPSGSCGCQNSSATGNITPIYSFPGYAYHSYWGRNHYSCYNSGTCYPCCFGWSCGQYHNQCCGTCPRSTYSVRENYWDYPLRTSDNYEATTTARVLVPYNFKTSASSRIRTGGDVIYAGENVMSSFEVSISDRLNSLVSSEEYLTITPADTRVQVVAFTLNPSVSAGTADGIVGGGVSSSYEDPCAYYRRRFGTSSGIVCNQLNNPGTSDGIIYGPFNTDGELSGEITTLSSEKVYSDIVPDVEVGSKYCVAVGISHADSHGYPDSNVPYGQGANGYSMGNGNPSWRVSNASCRTIAKKPNFQVWGGLYTQGSIATTVSKKYTNATVSSNGGQKIFGSWADTSVIGQQDIRGFSSGAGLGYIGGGGGAYPSKNYCQLINMTISNTTCNVAFQVSGYSGNIQINTSDLLAQIVSRYTPSSKVAQSGYNVISQPTQTLPGGAQYTYVNGSANLGGILSQNSGTRIIEVNGPLVIDHNICSGSGSCQSETNRNVLAERNNYSYAGSADIPQVIIIANQILISSNVTQIDAWLIVNNGEVNTCIEGNGSASSCANTLTFNGPIFAKSLTLNRTAGAFPGDNRNGAASAFQDLASANRSVMLNGSAGFPGYGSLTPAEIFNLRPDVYYWAYNQSNRLTQATVVYMRELAPRY